MKSIAKLLISLAICFTCDPLHVSAQENIPDEGDTITETPSAEKIEEQWAEELIYRANTVQLSADKSTLRYPVMEQKKSIDDRYLDMARWSNLCYRFLCIC